MKRWMLLVATLASATADAHPRHCEAADDIRGLDTCSQFGDWMPYGSAVFELGVSALSFRDDPADNISQTTTNGTTTIYRLTNVPGASQQVSGLGPRLRVTYAWSRTWYVVNQWDFANVVSGPPVRANISARGSTTMVDASTGGFAIEGDLLVGAHRRFGPISLSAEAGPGARDLYTEVDGLPMTMTQNVVIFPVQPKIDFWLDPSFSLGVAASIDVLHPDGATAGIVLGVHLMPYDMSR
jgi:hypothetical protein